MKSLVLCLALFGADVNSDPPIAVIDGPASGQVGDQFVFSSHSSENHKPKSCTWRILPEGTRGFLVVDGSTRAVFSNHEPGEYTVILSVVSTDGERSSIATQTILVGEHLVANPPQPKLLPRFNPQRPVRAMPPRNYNGYSPADYGVEDDEEYEEDEYEEPRPSRRKTRAAGEGFSRRDPPDVKLLAIKWTQKVQSELGSRKRDAHTLAGTFRQTANLLATNNIDSAEELIKATSVLATQALMGSWPSWKPWFDELQDYLDGLAARGSLDNMDDYRAVWLRIAEGLDSM